MRAQLPVQIGHADNIDSLHRRRARRLVDNAQWPYQFKTIALQRGKKKRSIVTDALQMGIFVAQKQRAV
ncbi:hypothetical protein [Janthinobacterium sp. ROICE36]|uniref:hypothetical protein n=1 Tax=Janthinobacterium sp. ROICE36 TaxID=2048670 RepID=UPI0011AF4144|nr:hypothetical protein [Janthinobacterium sp. ROICE36]